MAAMLVDLPKQKNFSHFIPGGIGEIGFAVLDEYFILKYQRSSDVGDGSITLGS